MSTVSRSDEESIAAAEVVTSTAPIGDGRWLHRLTEPLVLFPILAVVMLSVVWLAALNVTRVERSNARQTALATSRELLDTYEA